MDFIFDLLLALLLLTIWEKTSWKKCLKIIGTIGLFVVSGMFSGWPFLPMLFVAAFYYNRDNRQKQMKYFAMLVTGFTILSTLSLLTPAGWLGDTSIPVWGKLYFLGFLIAIPLLKNYNGQLGKSKDLKWLFYIIYPGHLMILYLVKELSVFQLYCAISIMVLVFLTFMIIKSLLEVPSKAQIYFVLSMCGVAAFVLGVLLELLMSASLEGALACLTMEFHSLFYINPVISYS